MKLSRRQFIQQAALAMGASFAWACRTRASRLRWVERRDLYPEGVASGDPAADGVILWTRRPFEGGGARTLTVEVAEDQAFLRKGAIHVAPPDHHLLIDDGRLRLTHGPREHHTRPAIDSLFRSAALWGGPRVIGVVLSGRNDDGTAGLQAIKACGGMAIVQHPQDAEEPTMPRRRLGSSGGPESTVLLSNSSGFCW